MSIEESKKELTKMIAEIEDASVLNKLLNYFRTESMLSEKQKKAIDAAIIQFENGEGIPHNNVMHEMKERYPKLFNS
jgi:DNA polymerase IIIc chi subunit